jgi:hypothetical protein
MRTSFFAAAAVTAGMLAAVACARRDASDDRRPAQATLNAAALNVKASCDMTAVMGACSEYRSGTTFGLERAMCDTHRGRFTTSACPEAGRRARCEMSGGEVKRYYGQLSLADAKADCESELARGTFVVE